MTEPFDLSVTDKLLSTTRAVRRRLDLERPVERDVILDCVRLSQQAPTGGNAQGWSWVVVMDPAKRKALAELYNASGDVYLPQAHAAAQEKGDAQTTRVYSSAMYLNEILADVPALVIPCMQGAVPEGAGNATAAAMYGSIFPAVWSFQLALRSRGLGSTLTTIHLFKEAETAELLGIPEGWSQVGLLPVAYTKGADFKVVDRPGPETITHFDAW